MRSQDRTMLSFIFHKESFVGSCGCKIKPSMNPILFLDSRAMTTARRQEPKLSPFKGVILWLGWSAWWMKKGPWGSSGREEIAAMKEIEMVEGNKKTSNTISQLLQHKETKKQGERNKRKMKKYVKYSSVHYENENKVFIQ